MQNRITKPVQLLDDKGQLAHAGYATHPLFTYRRQDIKAAKYRIKEWDYYLIANERYAVAMTLADNGYMGFASSSVMDFENPWQQTTVIMTPFPMGKFSMPPSSEAGDIHFANKRATIDFTVGEGKRTLKVDFKNFCGSESLQGEIVLAQPKDESMVIATPFSEDKKAFYYNEKINCMPAEGEVTLGGRTYTFHGEDSFGVLDWGRGVWSYKNTWYWGSASSIVNGKRFGFNIGYGFGDTSAASENMLFYDGVAHKLDQVQFHIPDDYLKPWTFTSNDGRFELDFVPILDRADHTNAVVIESNQHQVFGRFTGKVILDDGTALEIKDLLGFAEEVFNRW